MASEPTKLPAVHEAWLPREHALYRPRHGGRQFTALICAIVFFVTPTLFWVFGMRAAEIENHRLSGFPSISAGWGVLTGLPTWATEQLPFRGGAIQAADQISRIVFGEPAPQDQPNAADTGPLPGSVPETQPADPGLGPAGNPVGYRKVVEGKEGWLYYGMDADARCAPVRPINETMAKLGALKDAVESSGRRFLFVVPPDKSTMVPQYLPASYANKNCAQEAESRIWTSIANGGAIDLRPSLRTAEQTVGHPVYTPNDTHWTDEGALILTKELADAIRPGVTQNWQSAPVDAYTTDADLPVLLSKSGQKTTTRYDLRPDGIHNRVNEKLEIQDIEVPVHRRSAPIGGMVNEPTFVYGDSFLASSSRYLIAAFADVTMLSYGSKTNPQAAIDGFINSETVVIQAVERNVSAGTLSFLDDSFIDAVRSQLAQHPVR